MTSEAQAGPVDQAARWLGWAWHTLVIVLVVVGTVRATATDAGAGPWAAAAVLLALEVIGIVIGAWPDFAATEGDRWAHVLDATGVLAVVMAVSAYPDAYVWLAFPVGLVVFHRLSSVRSVLAGTLLAIGCLTALARVGPLTGPRILGPVIGLAVAVAGATAIRTLQAEAARRWQLVVELRETRELVAVHEHQAGVLEERARLARDIHDTVAQGLASILMLSAAVQRELPDPPGRVGDHLARLDDVARQDLAATRRLIANLAPADIEQFDLAHALCRRAERVRGSADVDIDLAVVELPPLAREVEVAVLRIVGQALDNAVTHADPDRIRISVTTVGDRLVADVHDDGSGFDTDASSGRGIAGMRTRAEALDGILTIESHPDGGTVVAVELPLGLATSGRHGALPVAQAARDGGPEQHAPVAR